MKECKYCLNLKVNQDTRKIEPCSICSLLGVACVEECSLFEARYATNREWLHNLTDMQLSCFMTIGLPVHDLRYDFDIVASIHNFRTPKEFREWLSKPQHYEYGWKEVNDNEAQEEKLGVITIKGGIEQDPDKC